MRLEKVWTVVVTYYPPLDLPTRLEVIRQGVGKVIVVDNGSPKQDLLGLESMPGVEVIRNPKNLGLAAAQNQGLLLAMEQGAEWVLFLDQDSQPEPGFLEAMRSYYETLSVKDRRRLLLLAPQVYEEGGGYFCHYILPWRGFLFRRVPCRPPGLLGVLFVISSGTLVPVERFQELGVFREDFFIDYIDTEFCLRGLLRGFEIHVICGAVLRHRLGRREVRRLGPLTFKPTHHPVWRKFYLYRNRCQVLRLYGRRIPAFWTFEICAMVYDLLQVILFEDERFAKLRAAWQGLLAGLCTKI